MLVVVRVCVSLLTLYAICSVSIHNGLYTLNLLTDLHWYYWNTIFFPLRLNQPNWFLLSFPISTIYFHTKKITHQNQCILGSSNWNPFGFGDEIMIENKIEIDLLSLLSLLFLVKHTDTPLTVRKPIPLANHDCIGFKLQMHNEKIYTRPSMLMRPNEIPLTAILPSWIRFQLSNTNTRTPTRTLTISTPVKCMHCLCPLLATNFTLRVYAYDFSTIAKCQSALLSTANECRNSYTSVERSKCDHMFMSYWTVSSRILHWVWRNYNFESISLRKIQLWTRLYIQNTLDIPKHNKTSNNFFEKKKFNC